MNTLPKAIELIKAGKNSEAQQLLQPLIESDKTNITAWLWYIETWKTDLEKVRALELCLTYNPDNERVRHKLASLQPRLRNTGAPRSLTSSRGPIILLAVVLILCAACPILSYVSSAKFGTSAVTEEIPQHDLAAVMHSPYSSIEDPNSVWLLVVIGDWRHFDLDKAKTIARHYEAQYTNATSFIVIFLCDYQYTSKNAFVNASDEEITAHALFEYVRPQWLTTQDNPYGTACS